MASLSRKARLDELAAQVLFEQQWASPEPSSCSPFLQAFYALTGFSGCRAAITGRAFCRRLVPPGASTSERVHL